MDPLLEKTQQYYNITFDSVSDLTDTVRQIQGRIIDEDFGRNQKFSPYYKQWMGRDDLNDLDDCCNAIEKQWKEGMRVYTNLMNQLHDEQIPSPKSLKRKRCWDEDAGTEISLERLQEGNPYFRSTKRDHRPGPVSVTLIAGISTSASRNYTEVLWRGAAAVCLTELLEQAGYRVELWSSWNSIGLYTSRANCLLSVLLKQGGDPLDISTFINVTSGWSFRSVWFGGSWFPPEAFPDSHYGGARTVKGMEEKITPDSQVIICDSVWCHSEAVRWIRESLAALK